MFVVLYSVNPLSSNEIFWGDSFRSPSYYRCRHRHHWFQWLFGTLRDRQKCVLRSGIRLENLCQPVSRALTIANNVSACKPNAPPSLLRVTARPTTVHASIFTTWLGFRSNSRSALNFNFRSMEILPPFLYIRDNSLFRFIE